MLQGGLKDSNSEKEKREVLQWLRKNAERI
jgi:hypothetical protein